MARKGTKIKPDEKIYKAAQEGYYRAGDVAEIMGISQSRAYKIIAAMRAELINEGKIPDYYPNGHVPATEFRKKFLLDD